MMEKDVSECFFATASDIVRLHGCQWSASIKMQNNLMKNIHEGVRYAYLRRSTRKSQ